MIRQTQALFSKYSNAIGEVENKGTWMGGMTSLFSILLDNIHITTHFLVYFVFQSDPDTERTQSDVLWEPEFVLDGLLELAVEMLLSTASFMSLSCDNSQF